MESTPFENVNWKYAGKAAVLTVAVYVPGPLPGGISTKRPSQVAAPAASHCPVYTSTSPRARTPKSSLFGTGSLFPERSPS